MYEKKLAIYEEIIKKCEASKAGITTIYVFLFKAWPTEYLICRALCNTNVFVHKTLFTSLHPPGLLYIVIYLHLQSKRWSGKLPTLVSTSMYILTLREGRKMAHKQILFPAMNEDSGNAQRFNDGPWKKHKDTLLIFMPFIILS